MRQKIILTPTHRATHIYVIGQSGTGKSRMMESMILHDINEGHGVGLIDPHGDLYDSLVIKLAMNPHLWDRIVLVNPTDKKYAISIDPLEPIPGFPMERTASFMMDAMMKIWDLNPSNAPRMLWLVSNTFSALSDLGLSLLDFRRFLVDSIYRNKLLPRISNHRVRAYFEQEFPTSKNTINEWVSPALNKIGALIFDSDIQPMLASGRTLNLRKVTDENKILLVNLSKGLLGEGAGNLLGAFIMARLQSIILTRADTKVRTPFYLYLDEFQNYTTDNIKVFITESRKYELSMTFAHQYLEQIPPDIQSAAINTAGIIVSFRVGHQDAIKLVKEMFPSVNYGNNHNGYLEMKYSGSWAELEFKEKEENRNWDTVAQNLTSLQQREFWVKRRGVSYPTKHYSHDVPDIEITPELEKKKSELIEHSGRRFGRLKQVILKEYRNDGASPSHDDATDDDAPGDAADDGIPLWHS